MEKELISAKIYYEKCNSKLAYMLLGTLSLLVFVIGFFVLGGYETSQNVSGDDITSFYWFTDWLYFKISDNGVESVEIDYFGILLMIIEIVAPFIFYAIFNAINEKCASISSLKITESKVYGTYNVFLSQRTLSIPIEKVHTLSVFSGAMDKLRSGKTLGIASASGLIKIKYVHNAEQVVDIAMKRIDELKTDSQREKKETIIKQEISSSNADELKKYKDLFDGGVITQEEFDAKKKQLLGL